MCMYSCIHCTVRSEAQCTCQYRYNTTTTVEINCDTCSLEDGHCQVMCTLVEVDGSNKEIVCSCDKVHCCDHVHMYQKGKFSCNFATLYS